MPRADNAKTVSARSLFLAAVICLAMLAALVVAARLQSRPTYATDLLRLGSDTIRLQVADTPQKQEKGLGGRDNLPSDQGMLFPYSAEGRRCFWMKGMRFPIDMIWLDAPKHIVHIESGVSPASYPRQYCPAVPTQYVIELPAGLAAKQHLTVGQQLHF